MKINYIIDELSWKRDTQWILFNFSRR